MNKKKVLHLLSSNKFSGAENVACTIIDNMKEKYEMVYCSPDGEIKETLNDRNIRYIPITTLNIKQIGKVVKKFKPDIIHAHDFKATFYATFFAGNSEIISHIHKNDPKMKKLSLKSILYLINLIKIKKVIGVSESILNEYIFSYAMKNKYLTIYNFVDSVKIKKLADEISINENYDILYLGRMSEEKNPLEFIEIIKRLSIENLNCVMIGDGPLLDSCKEMVNKYDLQNKIKILGYKSNPFPHIKKAKMAIMPSRYEGFGLTAIEMMVLKKPVLNSGAGGLNEIFEKYPEYICKDRMMYIAKTEKILNDFKELDFDLNKFTNKYMWKSKMLKVYEE